MSLVKSGQPVLIVEDSDDDYETTLRTFKKVNNFANPVIRCENGQEALDYLYRKGKYTNPEDAPRPGIILLDLNMPGKDGRAILGEIKSDVRLKEIPVVVLTTSSDSRDIEDCYQKGANTYIQKPVDLDRFFEAIKRLKDYWFEIAVLPKGDEDEQAA